MPSWGGGRRKWGTSQGKKKWLAWAALEGQSLQLLRVSTCSALGLHVFLTPHAAQGGPASRGSRARRVVNGCLQTGRVQGAPSARDRLSSPTQALHQPQGWLPGPGNEAGGSPEPPGLASCSQGEHSKRAARTGLLSPSISRSLRYPGSKQRMW